MKSKIKSLVKKVKKSIHNATRPEEIAPQSVSEVLADFEKKITHLVNVGKAKKDAAAEAQKRAAQLAKDSEAFTSEANRAELVANKLKDLVS